METIKLKATKRESIGKKETKKLRKEGLVPGVIYGEKENIHFSLELNTLGSIIYTPNVYIINVDIDGVENKCILQEIQYHPVSGNPIHADFLPISEDKKTSIKIPVKLNGVSKGVQQGGKLQMKMRKLKVSGFPKDFPNTLDINISEVGLGQSVKIDTLSFDNLEILEAKNAVVCSVKLTRSAMRDKAAAGK
jgi:large subunit ribosomal protein L25